MKANVLLSGLLAPSLLSACAPQTPAPTPVPAPRPVATTAPAAPPPPRFTGDWRDAPLTPGAWRWSVAGGQSVASFGLTAQSPPIMLACIAKGSVQLRVAGNATTATPIGITTSGGTFPLMSDPPSPGATAIVVTLPARAPVLDAMAFSRGRFVIEVAGQLPSYLPAWPEVARVIEDCR